MNVNIRDCRLEDEKAYCELNRKFIEESISGDSYWSDKISISDMDLIELFKDALASTNGLKSIIAEYEGVIVGFANLLLTFSIWSKGKAIIIDDLYVETKYRNMKIAESIMGYIERFANENRYRRIQLHTDKANAKALNLYRKLGYSEDEMIFFMKRM